jgi:hypothetical protein
MDWVVEEEPQGVAEHGRLSIIGASLPLGIDDVPLIAREPSQVRKLE